MPSLFTHWIVAQDALESLPAGPGREAIERHAAAYYLGALGPDLPYFDIFHAYRGLPLGPVVGPVTHTLEARVFAWLGWSLPRQDGWALRLHSPDARAQVETWLRAAVGRHPPLAGLLAGMLTHCCADEVLHPFVDLDAGAASTAATLRTHRELEINLDFVLLRARGVAVESLNLGGILEVYLGRVDSGGEYLGAALKRAWIEASEAAEPAAPLRRGEVDAWSRGFAGAMRLLEHPLSPVQRERRRFVAGGEERWRTFFARGRYLSSHVPRAVRAAQGALAEALPYLGLRGPARTAN